MTFDNFWDLYPNRNAKKDAFKAWTKLDPSPALQEKIAAALIQQLTTRAAKTMRRQWVPEWPLPASWLRGERWTDEIAPPARPAAPRRNPFADGEEIELV